MRSWRAWLITALPAALVAVTVTSAAGQGFNGAITGVVNDSSGGVVPETALTLRNIATDQTVGHDASRGRTANTPSATSRRPSTR